MSGNIVVLVGGVGGAKLALGLSKIVPPENLTFIVNTGDDFWHLGLYVCPDLDTVMYTLADVVNQSQGWGLENESTITLDALNHLYGISPWFKLGDKDLATHLLRTQMLRDGKTLTHVMETLACRLGLAFGLLPMSDVPAPTQLGTNEYGQLDFQTYFVKYHWQPTLTNISYGGANASVSDNVRNAIEQADAIIVAPSNPWLSIAPILAVDGMRDAMLSRDIPRIAVTPLIEGKAVKGPTAKLMAELGYEVSLDTIVSFYGELINGFVYDERDAPFHSAKIPCIAYNTYMTTESEKVTLATHLLNWIRELSS